MALFGRAAKDKGGGKEGDVTRPLVGRTIYCSVCSGPRSFSRCWRRMHPLGTCPCCGLAFQDAGVIYAQAQPACPKCGEPLEYPGFDYGLCDGCGSKFEILEGTKPGLLPNRAQRAEMSKHGKARVERP
ncbi:MAG: hypothetical protein HYV26_10220 [Candidatus Hydrogenedentes bacterium]|nr:hypothetical protein [Candidatus Hydrogenedentota bacterium]